jgi:apolipoprotein N-acyltransferase
MESNDNRRAIFAGVAATLLSSAAWWFGTGLAPHAWLTWFAPLPLLLIAPRLRWGWTALAALCAGACAGLNLWHYVRDIIRLPLATGVLVAAVPALNFALCLLLYRRLWRSGRVVAATLAFPSLFVALEYLSSLGSPHGTFGSLAYTQMDALPVIQLASLTGIWGVTFVLMLASSALAATLMPATDKRRRTVIGGGTLLLVAAIFAFGSARLQEPAHASMRVGLASLEGPVRPSLALPVGDALLQRYLATIDALAAQGAQAVVLPESAFEIDGTSIPAFAARAARHNLIINTGVALKDALHGERNAALAFAPGIDQPVVYAKRHLIPGFESNYKAGTEYAMLPGSGTGLAICKDMDFHDIGSAYAERGAKLLLVPAWDFRADGWLHSRMAVMRGIESGFAVARVARRGNLTLSDDRGRIVAETTDEHGDAQLVGDLPLHRSSTLYARWGDWFAWLTLAVLLFLSLQGYGANNPISRKRS